MVDEAQLPALVVIGAPDLEPHDSLFVLRCSEPGCPAKHRVTANTALTVRQLKNSENPPIVVCYGCYLKGLAQRPDLPPPWMRNIDDLRRIHRLPEG